MPQKKIIEQKKSTTPPTPTNDTPLKHPSTEQSNTNTMQRIAALLSVIFTLTLTQPLSSKIAFSHLNDKNGLPTSEVNDLIKDHLGFLWIATSTGLHRYDGYTFHRYTHNEKDPHSIPINNISHLLVDGNNRLWINAQFKGYYYFDPIKEQFCPPHKYLADELGITERAQLLYVDSEKNLWIHTSKNEMYLHRWSDKQTIACPDTEAKAMAMSQTPSGVATLYDNGSITISESNTGRRIDSYPIEGNPNSHHDYKNKSLFVDSKGNCWVYSKESTGVAQYIVSEKRWERYTSDENSRYQLANDRISEVAEDGEGNIWIGSDHGGIQIIDPQTDKVTYLAHEPNQPQSLTQNSIYALYLDNDNTMWVGTYDKGVSYYNRAISNFEAESLSNFRADHTPIEVNYIAASKKGGFWLGTNGEGLHYFDPATKTYRQWHRKKLNPHETDYIITSIYEDDNGYVWLGTYQQGIIRFDGNDFKSYLPKDRHDNYMQNIWSIAQGPDGKLWLGTLTKGLQLFDPATGDYTSCFKEKTPFGYIAVTSIVDCKEEKKLYLSTNSGLVIYTHDTGQAEMILGNRNKTAQFTNADITQVIIDSRKLIWLTTRAGLYAWDRTTDHLYTFTNIKQLHDRPIHGIIEDNQHNLWVTTSRHIIKITPSETLNDERYTFTTKPHDPSDGYHEQIISQRSIIKDSEGRIVIGGSMGITFIDSKRWEYNTQKPNVLFTALRLYNERVEIDSLYQGRTILTKAINMTDRIELAHDQQMIEISFSGLDMIAPNKMIYHYRLINNSNLGNNDQTWYQTTGNYVSLLKPPSGNYTLEVKATNSDGYESDTYATLQLIIKPPYWASTWAIGIYILIGIGILLLIRYKYKQRIATNEERQRNENEKEQIILMNEIRLRLFTNISHEVRTPLSMILAPLESLQRKASDKPELQQDLDMIHRNAERLLKMINQLLDIREAYSEEQTISPTETDITMLIQTTSQPFIELSRQKGIQLVRSTPTPPLFVLVDAEKTSKIITNLLSNALKFTPKGGRIELSSSYEHNLEPNQVYIEIRIADSGIGIPKEQKAKVFDRFYQASNVDKTEGYGLGLHVVKEYLKLLNGSIDIKDNTDKGTIVILHLTLPKVKHQHTPPATLHTSTPTLPLPEEKEREAHTATPGLANNTMETSDRRLSILVVDGNEDVRTFIASTLDNNYLIRTSSDGAAAWQMLTKEMPDMIIYDTTMPEMDGNAFCRLIKEDIQYAHIPVILMTVRPPQTSKKEEYKGADAYISKPFNIKDIREKVTLAEKQIKSRQQVFASRSIIDAADTAPISPLDKQFIKHSIAQIRLQINDNDFGVEMLSIALEISRSTLYNKLRSITGKTPIEFIQTISLEYAAQLLHQQHLSIEEVALQSGFETAKKLNDHFLHKYGMTPTDYQQIHNPAEATVIR